MSIKNHLLTWEAPEFLSMGLGGGGGGFQAQITKYSDNVPGGTSFFLQAEGPGVISMET